MVEQFVKGILAARTVKLSITTNRMASHFHVILKLIFFLLYFIYLILIGVLQYLCNCQILTGKCCKFVDNEVHMFKLQSICERVCNALGIGSPKLSTCLVDFRFLSAQSKPHLHQRIIKVIRN